MAQYTSQEQATLDGSRALDRLEEGCDKLIAVLANGMSLGMMANKCEHDRLMYRTRTIQNMILELHVELTAIAKRCGTDGVIITPTGGPGR